MNVTRIMSKKGKIIINHLEPSEGKGSEPDKHGLESADLPLPEFSAAFNQMKTHLATLLELPKKDVEKLHMECVDIKYSGEAFISVQLKGSRDVSISKAGHSIETSWFGFDEAGKNKFGEKNVMPKECHDDLKKLIDYAEAYLDGDRAQQVLNFDGDKDKDEEYEPDVAM